MINKFWVKTKLIKDSLIYTKSRKSATRSIISVSICIILAVILSLLIVTILGNNPFTILSELFSRGFIDWKYLIWNISVLGIGALAFSFAFRAGIFNIGIPGQMIGTGLIVLIITDAINKTQISLPNGLGPIISLLIAILAGGIIASIVALLKTYLNVNEVVASILLNWIIFFITRLVIFKYYNPDTGGLFSQSIEFANQFQLTSSSLGGWLPAIIIFAILVFGIFFINKYTTFGHKVYAVGCSKTAAKYAGYNQRVIHISTMMISGGLAGIMALIFYTSGESACIAINYNGDVLPPQGYNGIAIGLVALCNPLAIIPISFIIGLFISSSNFLSIPVVFNQVIIGTIILGAAMFVLLARYKPWLWIIKHIYGNKGVVQYQKYENEMESLISKYRPKISECSKSDLENIWQQYLSYKQAIFIENKKELLILKIIKSFNPKIDAEFAISQHKNLLKNDFLLYENHKIHKIFKQREISHFKYDNLIAEHNRLNYLYDLAWKKQNLFNKQSDLKLLFINFVASLQQKYQFIDIVIDKTMIISKDFNNNLVNDLLVLKKENQKRFEEVLEQLVTLTKLNLVKNNINLKKYINDNFDDLTRINKKVLIKIYKNFTHYSISFTVQKLLNEINKSKDLVLLSDETINKMVDDFVELYKRKIISYQKFNNNLNKLEVKINNKILNSKEQIKKWEKEFEKRYWIKFNIKQKISGSVKQKYNKLKNKINKLQLDKKQTQQMMNLLDKYFSQISSER